jgi:hypothetical protein
MLSSSSITYHLLISLHSNTLHHATYHHFLSNTIKMQLQILSVFATLLAATQAAPAASSLEARKSVNDCSDSTFINQSSGGSPTIGDCQTIARNIAGKLSFSHEVPKHSDSLDIGGGTWTVGLGGEHHQLVQAGTCAFGINGDSSANAAYIGNQDIIDLINTSIQRFSWEGKVGAKGHMSCQSLQGLIGGGSLTWGLYHT